MNMIDSYEITSVKEYIDYVEYNGPVNSDQY